MPARKPQSVTSVADAQVQQQLAQLRLERAQVEAQIPSDSEFKELQDARAANEQAQRDAQLAQLASIDDRVAEVKAVAEEAAKPAPEPDPAP